MIRLGLSASIVITGLMVAASLYGWTHIAPETQIPVRWNLDGEATSFMSRNAVIFLFPAVAILTSIVFAFAVSIDPRKENVTKSEGLVLTTWIGSLAVLGVGHALFVSAAMAERSINTPAIISVVAFFIAVIGNYLGKSRSSWFFGFQTPWGLLSEDAWIASNRAVGRLWVATALAAIIAIWFEPRIIGVLILIIGVIASLLIGVFIAYRVWRADPDRVH
ncbi:MAG: SdpI family protein [Pseudomonadota bacterium]